MPPAAFTSDTARSVLTSISAPSTAVLAAWSSRTPIRIGDPLACVGPDGVEPPPQAATTRPAIASSTVRLMSLPPKFEILDTFALFDRLQSRPRLRHLDQRLRPSRPAQVQQLP